MDVVHAYRRFLPHYQNPEKTYFITFCSRNRRILTPEARTLALKEIVNRHRVFYCLQIGIVMPDHIHLVLTPIDTSLADIVKRIKGASAREINRYLNNSGPFWQREYFDREVRTSENLRAKCEYVATNPVRADLVARPDDYPWLWRAWVEGGEEWL